MTIDRIDLHAMGAAELVSDGLKPNLSDWLRESSKDGLHRAALEIITPQTEKPFLFETTACFAKGALVHTKEGLVPIEKLRVGDWVLSKPEDGTGELAYKRVTHTFAHGPTEVVNLLYRFGGKDDSIFAEYVQHRRLTTTMNHPIWVIGNGWTDVGELNQWPGKESQLVLADGRHAIVTQRESIFQTSRPNIGWSSSIGNVTDVLGGEWDFENQCVHQANVRAEEMIQELNYPAILKIPASTLRLKTSTRTSLAKKVSGYTTKPYPLQSEFKTADPHCRKARQYFSPRLRLKIHSWKSCLTKWSCLPLQSI